MATEYEMIYKLHDTKCIADFKIREKERKRYGFAVLTEEAIKQLRPYAPFIEVGSGNGYWAYEMQKRGVEIVATDLVRVPNNIYRFDAAWTTIQWMTAKQAINKYPKHTLLIVWPCYDKPWAYQALKEYKGDTLVFCGESWGCTGDNNFHQLLEDEWVEPVQINIPCWFGLYDCIYVYTRRQVK